VVAVVVTAVLLVVLLVLARRGKLKFLKKMIEG
jgi:hypothetical protein